MRERQRARIWGGTEGSWGGPGQERAEGPREREAILSSSIGTLARTSSVHTEDLVQRMNGRERDKGMCICGVGSRGRVEDASEERCAVSCGLQGRAQPGVDTALPAAPALPSCGPAVLRSCSPAVSHLKFTHSHFKLLLSVLLRLPLTSGKSHPLTCISFAGKM